MKRFITGILALCALVGCSTSENNPVLTVEGGKIQGVKDELPGVYVYRGIPYAAPPIRDLRWKEPQPVEPWDGVKVCDTFGHPSFQAQHYTGGYTTEWGYGKEQAYSEDCLYLNVWTKAPGETDKKLPVAVWIHGGGLREGWGSEPEFYAEEWAAKDVVLVSFNYRLGVFGFTVHPALSAESEHGVSGNYGIMDQIAALKWVKNNIAQFGGDPDNVTIFGQSAGGRSTRTLSESPLARGLFNKAIIMSAGGLNHAAPFETVAEAEQRVKTVMDWAGLETAEQMRAVSTEEMFALQSIYNRVHGLRPAGIFAPTVDGYVVTKNFDEAAVEGTLADVPYMIGYTRDDSGDMSKGIIEFGKNRESLGGKAYAYQFARPLPTDGRANVLSGAFHSSDLWFIFKSLKYCWRPWTKGDWDLSEKMITAWSDFVKTGNPDPDGKLGWKPCTEESPEFMVFCLDENDNEASYYGQPIPKPAL